jgi:hypothetical protein
MRRLLVAVAILGVAFAGLPAGGHEIRKNDPNDTPGKLDIYWASMDHNQDQVIVKAKVNRTLTHSRLSGGNYLTWGLFYDQSRTVTVPSLILFDEAEWQLYLEFGPPFRIAPTGTNAIRCYLYDSEGKFVNDKLGNVSGKVGTCKFGRNALGGVPDGFRAGSVFNSNTDTTSMKTH